MTNQVPICRNHLADLYEALKREDLSEVKKVSHVLTNQEKCVACSYLFVSHGKVREALEKFLTEEGFCIST